MMCGNPAVDIWNGIRIGRGVGEEEKEVLGGFAERNRKESDGSERLIDLVVSRFGRLIDDEKDTKKVRPGFSSRGTGRIPGPDDGCIYRGVGNLSKESVRDIAEWMSRWYQYGDSSFDYLTARPSRKKARRTKSSKTPDPPSTDSVSAEASTSNTEDIGTRVPPPLIPSPEPQPASKQPAKAGPDAKKHKKTISVASSTAETAADGKSGNNNALVLNVLTLGTYAAYSAWNRSREDPDISKPATPDATSAENLNPIETSGRFITGYTGDLEEEDDEEAASDPKIHQQNFISSTIWVRRRKKLLEGEDIASNEIDDNAVPDLEECRLVAYAVCAVPNCLSESLLIWNLGIPVHIRDAILSFKSTA